MKYINLSKHDQNNLVILEHYYGYEWWKSSQTGRRCLFPPNTIPRDFSGSNCAEWFLERADGTEDLVGDFNIKNYSDFYSDFNKAFELLFMIRDRFKSGFTICDYNYFRFDLNLVDCNIEITGASSIPEAIVEVALKLIEKNIRNFKIRVWNELNK